MSGVKTFSALEQELEEWKMRAEALEAELIKCRREMQAKVGRHLKYVFKTLKKIIKLLRF